MLTLLQLVSAQIMYVVNINDTVELLFRNRQISHWLWFAVYSTLVSSGPLKLLFQWTKIIWTNLHMFKIVDHIFLAFCTV